MLAAKSASKHPKNQSSRSLWPINLPLRPAPAACPLWKKGLNNKHLITCLSAKQTMPAPDAEKLQSLEVFRISAVLRFALQIA